MKNYQIHPDIQKEIDRLSETTRKWDTAIAYLGVFILTVAVLWGTCCFI